jgi:hypothetical protein
LAASIDRGSAVVNTDIMTDTYTHHHALRIVAAAGLVAFVVLTVLQHAVSSRLDPASHQISEYANGSAGALMTIAFLAWAISCAALAGLSPSRAVAAALALASIGLVVAAAWDTQTVAGVLPAGVEPTTSGHLHDIGSGTAAVALLGATLGFTASPASRPSARRATAYLLATGLTVAFVLALVGHEVAGIRQRALVLTACAWQAVAIRRR